MNNFFLTFFRLACYMNAFLQALFMINEFKSYIINIQTPLATSAPLLGNLKNLFEILLKKKEFNFSMEKFKKSLPGQFNKSEEQQDAMEFGRIFLEELESILKGKKEEVFF